MITKLVGKEITFKDNSPTPCYEDMSNGEAMSETPQPVCAVKHGDNPMNSERPRQDSRESFVDGPFGGKTNA